jgi:hypothetical protein
MVSTSLASPEKRRVSNSSRNRAMETRSGKKKPAFFCPVEESVNYVLLIDFEGAKRNAKSSQEGKERKKEADVDEASTSSASWRFSFVRLGLAEGARSSGRLSGFLLTDMGEFATADGFCWFESLSLSLSSLFSLLSSLSRFFSPSDGT